MRPVPGEPPCGPWRVIGLPDLADLLVPPAAGPGGRPAAAPRIVAIDGRGGAGKSTLAARLASLIPRAAVVHTDDLAWHHSFFGWDEPLVEHVLRPLAAGSGVHHRPRAWQERGREGAITVPAGLAVVLVEGTGLIRPALAPWFTSSVWVQSDEAEADARLIARDGDSPEERELVRKWQEEEVPLLRRWRPWARATVVVAGTRSLPHDPRREVVVAPPAAG